MLRGIFFCGSIRGTKGVVYVIGSGISLIGLLVDLVIAGIVLYAVYLILNMLNLPEPIRTLILLIIAVIVLVFLAGIFGVKV
jgi:hypothetical protein